MVKDFDRGTLIQDLDLTEKYPHARKKDVASFIEFRDGLVAEGIKTVGNLVDYCEGMLIEDIFAFVKAAGCPIKVQTFFAHYVLVIRGRERVY